MSATAAPPELDANQMAQLRRTMRNRILWAALVACISTGAAIMSCVGQSFAYRQATALESIDQVLGRALVERCK